MGLKNKIKGAALDVYSKEPLNKKSPLSLRKRCISKNIFSISKHQCNVKLEIIKSNLLFLKGIFSASDNIQLRFEFFLCDSSSILSEISRHVILACGYNLNNMSDKYPVPQPISNILTGLIVILESLSQSL